MKKTLTVIMKFSNDRETLRQLIPNLFAGLKSSNYNLEIIAYSETSNDGSFELMSYFAITHPVTIMKLVSAPTCKELLIKAHGTKLLFLNPGCCYPFTQLLSYVRAVKPKEVLLGMYTMSGSLSEKVRQLFERKKAYEFVLMRKQTLDDLVAQDINLLPEDIAKRAQKHGMIQQKVESMSSPYVKTQHAVAWRKVLPWLEVI